MTTYKTPKIIAVDVYAQGRKTRRYVGRLTAASAQEPVRYVFNYDEKYLRALSAVQLGPELPLTQRSYSADSLFPSFADRLPSRENPAYVEYLEKFKLSPDEKDPFVLLTTIGRAGPSSFIFVPVVGENFNQELQNFRSELGLTVRDFSAAFDVAGASVQRIEKGTAGREISKRLELYMRFPETALFEVERNSGKLHESVRQRLVEKLSTRKKS